MYKVCVHFLGYQDSDAEDIVQETFILALRKLPQFEFRSSLYSWLYRICVLFCYERLEKRRRQVMVLQEELETLSGTTVMERQKKDEENSEKHKLLELMESQRKLLGEPCRELLELRENKDTSYGRIAKLLKVPMGTVMSRLARCRAALKQLMLKALQEGKNGGLVPD